MKSKVIIIVLLSLFILGSLVLIFLNYRKKQVIPKNEENTNNSSGNNYPQLPAEKVKEWQITMNKLLPPNYEKLVVDGIWGAKTQAAFDYLKNTYKNNQTVILNSTNGNIGSTTVKPAEILNSISSIIENLISKK